VVKTSKGQSAGRVAMGDEQQKKDDGIDINLPGFEGSVDKETAQTLLSHIGPDLRWIVYSASAALLIVATCYGVSLVWN
jgi:hypothetical protein